MISNFIFSLLLVLAALLFYRSISRIIGIITSGKETDISDNRKKRWKLMGLVAIGQSKMVSRPLSAVLHIFVYVGGFTGFSYGFNKVRFEHKLDVCQFRYSGIEGNPGTHIWIGPLILTYGLL